MKFTAKERAELLGQRDAGQARGKRPPSEDDGEGRATAWPKPPARRKPAGDGRRA